jgi:hypothetical protein
VRVSEKVHQCIWPTRDHGLTVCRFCIKPSGLRPVYVGFMQVWPLITVKGVSFMRERNLSRSKRGKEVLGTAVSV